MNTTKRSMNESTLLQLHCETCKKDGFISLGNGEDEEDFLVMCSKCSSETAEAWCPNCRMGGQFIKNIKKHPSSWKCPQCKKTHTLSHNFYDSHKLLYFYDNFPIELKQAFENLNLRTPLEKAKRVIWISLAFYMAGYLVLFLFQAEKTIMSFISNADLILGALIASSSNSLPPQYIEETGTSVNNKKNWRASKWLYYFWAGLIFAGFAILALDIIFKKASVERNSIESLVLLIGIACALSLSRSLYSLLFGVYPLQFYGKVHFFKHKSLKQIASIQATTSLLGILWMYLKLTS